MTVGDTTRSSPEKAGPEVPEEGTGCAVPCVVFRLEDRRFLLEASLCRGVVPAGRVAPLPFTPPWVLGVTGIRGEVVSATDPRVLLGLEAVRDREPGYLLVVAAAGLKSALWVDRVDDVIGVDLSGLREEGGGFRSAPPGVVLGVWEAGGETAWVLDGTRYLEATAVVWG